MWVAFNRFPLSFLIDEVSDIRQEQDAIVDLDPNVDVEHPTASECARVGLSPKPVHGGNRGALTPEQLKEVLADQNLAKNI
jgi:hypothetical protein